MNAWDHLPNAKHIDWVLASVKKNPKAWGAAWNAAWNAASAARYAAWNSALDAALDAALAAALGAARYAALDAARTAARAAAWTAARDAAYGAIAALVAYDHCEKYLSMTPDELFVWWKLSDDPACLLLMPMAKVQTEKELA